MQNLLLYCGNGYQFDNYHEFIIKDLKGKCNVFLLMDGRGGEYLTKNLIKKIDSLVKELYIEKRFLINLNGSILNQYIECLKFFKRLSDEKIDLFLLGEEGGIIHCFLMEYFKLKGTKIVSNEVLIRTPLFRDYYKTKGVVLEAPKTAPLAIRLKRKIKNKEYKKILNAVSNLVRRKAKKPGQIISKIMGTQVIPFLLFGRTIQETNQYMIGSFCDYLIVVDAIEYEAAKLLIPGVKKIFFAKHPANGFYGNISPKIQNKLLVMVGGPNKHISDDQIARWVSVVQKIKKIREPVEIHLRNHPRERQFEKNKFIEAFKVKNIRVISIDPTQTPLAEGFERYMGVVTTFSSSLRFARAASPNIFSFSLTDVMGWPYIQPEVMGDSEGVHWLKEGDPIKKEMLDPPKQTNKKPSLLSIAEILIDIMGEKNVYV